jgi:hypothetical protein
VALCVDGGDGEIDSVGDAVALCVDGGGGEIESDGDAAEGRNELVALVGTGGVDVPARLVDADAVASVTNVADVIKLALRDCAVDGDMVLAGVAACMLAVDCSVGDGDGDDDGDVAGVAVCDAGNDDDTVSGSVLPESITTWSARNGTIHTLLPSNTPPMKP